MKLQLKDIVKETHNKGSPLMREIARKEEEKKAQELEHKERLKTFIVGYVKKHGMPINVTYLVRVLELGTNELLDMIEQHYNQYGIVMCSRGNPKKPRLTTWLHNGQYHRDGDSPAYIDHHTGLKVYYKHGVIHRDKDKPALISLHTLEYYKNGVRHRDKNKPAFYQYRPEDGRIFLMKWLKNGKSIKGKRRTFKGGKLSNKWKHING